ncbi:EAL domain-containing protein [Aquabacterium sp. A7-Y]|uniref:sensor domain-containing phosphodiesterase n=1 Tax=Aquabacterium sp. A7-Y TaxID=1349605 RepID=UPI00223DE07D|nr:EAL domain-containing protein [Aquabacterium sp. A7-Y]MCW7536576.1 EAL domain-containing protein [Aquabacterium sp. A7-Y]
MQAAVPEMQMPPLDFDGQQWTCLHRGLRLSSHFQPIFSLTHRRAVGHEALLRARDAEGRPVPPPEVLAGCVSLDELVYLDRVCRWLHAANFARQARPDHWLFLNVHPTVFAQGPRRGTLAYLEQVTRRFQLQPSQLVLEVTEDAISEDERFGAAVELAHNLGCLLALDDFGAGHSNFDRIWQIRPEIVKFDRHVVQRAALDPRVARVVAQMTSLLHECGALVLCEGIETLDEGYAALESGVDFVQGYLFGRPQVDLCPAGGPPGALDAVWQRFDEQHEFHERRHQARLAPYLRTIGDAAARLCAGIDADTACASFLALPGAELCYLLDEQGVQVGHTIMSLQPEPGRCARFAPLADASQARWAKRPYFRRALEAPGQVQVTRPYLSVNTARLCVTVSVSLRRGDQLLVLGGDVAWDPH